ncbi:quinolinate synthase NadA [Nitrolancea hollandica]|uniref:Quinolinate synthase n=1 Tax=Nitrolancea hollandica Lb TaxID=1129897 RepID=I4ENN8_9BACT|nr:quinolinate synthase NadA [Nitrolancea hollandica]CCF86301.1 quinolinate synthetase A [Nitrolancea hollandica Lb]
MSLKLRPVATAATNGNAHDIAALTEEINRLRRERNAVILAHSYQVPEVQDIADFVGDSLGLSRQAAKSDAEVIVFCGVHFMAETAAILCPEQAVLIPDLQAGCSLADSITADQLRQWKAEHPGAVVVSYVNTSAEVKAESDYCCTSANAVEIVRSIPEDQEILFLPDLFLGEWVRRETGRQNMHLWLGECHVHAGIMAEDVERARRDHPGAELLVHPECACGSRCMLDLQAGRLDSRRTHVLSTEGMVRHAGKSDAETFLVATETGVLHRLRQQAPSKEFFAVRESAVCNFMKMITLEKVHRSLRDLVYQVTVPEPIAARAKVAIDRMLSVGA